MRLLDVTERRGTSLGTVKTCNMGICRPLQLITGKEWMSSEKEPLQCSTSYTDTDLLRELCRIEEWFQKRPDRRKTERGMHNFVKV